MSAIYIVDHDDESRLQLHEFPLLSKSFHIKSSVYMRTPHSFNLALKHSNDYHEHKVSKFQETNTQ